MEPQKINQEALEQNYAREYADMVNTRDEMNRDLSEKRIAIITQKREWLQHVTLIALGIIGTSFFAERFKNELYFYSGLFLAVIVILFTLTYLREIFDSEERGLQKMQDRYNQAAADKIKQIEKYAVLELNQENYFQYLTALRSTPSAVQLKKDLDEQDAERENRDNQMLDYFGEFVSFLLISAVTLMLASLLPITIELPFLLLLILFILIFSFNDITTYLNKKLSLFMQWTKKRSN